MNTPLHAIKPDSLWECECDECAELRRDAGCPECGGDLMVLGQLGRLTHYRCRHCGADTNSEYLRS